jgi:hypothetical protein
MISDGVKCNENHKVAAFGLVPRSGSNILPPFSLRYLSASDKFKKCMIRFIFSPFPGYAAGPGSLLFIVNLHCI